MICRTALAPLTLVLAVIQLAWISSAPARADDDHLPTATPESQGISSDGLCALSRFIREKQLDVRSMVVVRHGRLVFEWYANGVTRAHNHNVYSVTKSVTATLAGIAIAEEKLPGVESSLATLLPDHVDEVRQSPLAAITLEDLLTMRSGLPTVRANKPTGPERDLFREVHRAPDRIARILRLPLVREPGHAFNYSNCEPQLVLGAVARAAGRSAPAFAERALFEPLDFKNHAWRSPDSTGLVPGGYGLRLRAIDMAKLGQLYLDHGRWNGRQLLPANYIDAATSDVTKTGYGYCWWTADPVADRPAFAARGLYGQLIQVVPGHSLVVVITANLPLTDVRPTFKALINDHLANAIRSDAPLAPDADAYAALQDELHTASRYAPPAARSGPNSNAPEAPHQ